MNFDPTTARPVDESVPFDPTTARPVDESVPFDPTTARPIPGFVLPSAVLLNTADIKAEDAAETLRLQRHRPESFDVLYRNLSDLKLQEAVDKADQRLRTDPKLSAYIGKRPEIAPLIRDDIEPLTEISRAVRSWAGGAAVGWTQAAKQEEMADLLYVEATGGSLTEQQARRLADLEREVMAAQADPRGAYAGGAARDQGYTARQIIAGLKAYATGALPGGLAGAAAGSVLPGVGTLIGAKAGIVSGGLVAGAAYSYKLETAFAYNELRKLRDVNGQPLPPELARLGAQAVGAVNAIIETASDVLVAGMVPGVKKAAAAALGRSAAEDVVKDALKAALADPARRSVVVEGIRSMLAVGSLEGVEEFVQALTGAGIRELVQRVSGQVFEPNPIGQDLEQAATEAFQAFRGSVLTAGVAVGAARGVSLYRAQHEQQEAAAAATEHAERLRLALREAGRAKARELSPEEFRTVAAEVTDGKVVYIAGDVLAQLPQNVLSSLPQEVQEQVAVAAEIGDLVKLDLADVLTVAPGTELERVVVEYGRATPESLTKAEVEDQAYMQARLQEEAQQIIAQAENATAAREEYLAVRDDFAAQIAATGRYSQKVAESMAEFVASFYTVYAKRAGMSVPQMRAAYPLRVLGEQTGTAAQEYAAKQPVHLVARLLEKGVINRERPREQGVALSVDKGAALDQGPYRGGHKPMTVAQGAATLDDLTPAFGEDIYSDNALQYFGSGDPREADVVRALKKLRGKPDAEVTIYRGVPADAEGINPGDWVTLSEAYARDYAEEQGGKVVSMKVPASHVTGWADSLLEFGYHPPRLNQSVIPLPDTIEVDGVQRPTRNSNGQLIHPTEEGIRNFWRWFSPQPSQILDGLSVSEIRSLERHTKALADFIERQSSLPKADRFKVIPRPVLTHMVGVVNNDKILDAVIRSIPVDVVNFLSRKKWSAKEALHDVSVLEDVLAVDPETDVSLGVNPSPLPELAVRLMANAGAKITGLTDGALERNAAVLANENDPVLGAHVAKSPNKDLGILAGFGDSKVVDEQGRPLVVYHGTKGDVSSFDIKKAGTSDPGLVGRAFYFTPSGEQASSFAESGMYGRGDAPNVMPVYLSLKNPAIIRDGVLPDGRSLRDVHPQGITKSSAASIRRELERQGYDGAVFYLGDEPTQYIAFRPEQIKSATGNRGTFDPADPNILKQGPRGTFNPRTFELILSPNADLSTWFHETGHFFLEVLADLATQPNAKPELVEDFQAVLRWFGVPDAATWNRMTLDEKRPYHERFAESVEQYVLEGRAPSAELRPLMRRFAAWLKSGYKSIQRFLAGRPDAEKMPLNDDIRRVMDRMLATDEQIAEAEQRAGLDPDPEATAEAQERLRARSMRDLRWIVNTRDKVIAKLRKEAKRIEQQIREEVTAQVEQMPVVRAAVQLAELQAKHEADPTAADMNVAVIADANGFASIDAMYREIERFGDKQAYIDGEVQRRMLEEHGELVDERAIADAANEAIHNEARARALATELKAQEEMLNARTDTGRTNAAGRRITVSAVTEAAKTFAAEVLRNVPLRDLRETAWRHTVAEREAGRRWRRATAAGKTEEAVKAKRDQVLHNAVVKAATEAQAEVRKTIEFFRKVTKGNDEKVVEKGRDPALVNAARAVLAAYGVQTPTTKRASQYLDLVAQYDPDTAATLQPIVQAALESAQPLDSLTLAEFRDVAALVDQLWHLARETRQLEIAGKKVEIDAAADDLYARMAEIGIPDVLPGENRTVTKAEQRKQWLLHDAPALLRWVEAWAEAKDGKWGGPFTRLIFQPVKDAADRYRAERVKYRERFVKLIEQNKDLFEVGPIDAPEIGYVFGAPGAASGVTAMSELLHALLHTGNSSNKAKLLAGRGWGVYDPQTKTLNTEQWDAFLARLHREGVLTKRHWDFVQAVWDLLEELKPAAQETHRKVFGRHFAEVTAEPVVTPFGVYRGGYAPAQIDPRLVKDGELKKNIETENANASFIFPQTNRGFTMSRVEAYRRPLLLDLRTFTQHIDKVLLFTHMEPAVRQTHRLLRHKAVSGTLNRVDPAAINAMLLPWLNRSARQVVETTLVADAGIGRALSLARARTGMGLMFANVINAIQQVTALSTALVKVSPADLARATAQYIQHPVETTHAVWEKSPAMRDRAKNEVAVLSDTMAEILINPSIGQRGEAFARKHAYFMQIAVDTVTATITWRAAYNQALRQGLDDESAVRFADSTVRQTHGSTLPEDVSRFETGHPAWRMFAQFMGYFNMLANTNATALQLALRESGAAGYGRAAYVALVGLLVPIWVAEAIAQALRGGPDDGDDDGELIDDWLAAVFGFGTLKGLTAMAPGLNWLGQLAAGQFTDSPADDRLAMSPTISLAERAIVGNVQTLRELADEDKEVKWQRAVRDAAALFTLLTGWPLLALARPAGYIAGVAQGRIEPTSELDLARGVITGAASPDSKQ